MTLYINIKSLLLEVFILNAIISGILVIIAKNPIISVIFLISLILNAALFLILKGITFIGISYILIYLGAIIVLFLFVIMMINVKLTDILDIGSQYSKNIPLAIIVSGLFLYIFLKVLPSYLNNPTLPLDSSFLYSNLKYFIINLNNFSLDTNIYYYGLNSNLSKPLLTIFNWPETFLISYTHILSVAYSLYTYGAFWFLLIGLILLLAMIAPIYLSK